MAGFRKHILLLFILFTVAAKAQDGDRISNVRQIYSVLQDKNASLQDLAFTAPGVNWDEIKAGKEDSRYTINLSAVLKNKWVSLVFRDLKYELSEKDVLLVTGIAEGRGATECEYISSRFKHSWVFKNGKIIKFLE